MKKGGRSVVVALAVVTTAIPLAAGFYVLLSFIAFDYPSTTVVVNAQTQILSYKLLPQRPYVWRLPPGTISWISEDLDGDGFREISSESAVMLQQLSSCSDDAKTECSDAETAGVRVVQSLNDEGFLAVSWIFGSSEEHFASASLYSEGRTNISGALRIDFESAQPLGTYQVSHLVRDVELGALLSPETVEGDSTLRQEILLDGEISFFAKTLVGHNRYLVENAILSSGDWVILRTDNQQELSAWIQLTYLPGSRETTALQTLVRAATDQVHVSQNQAGPGFLIGIGLFTIMAGEPFVTTLWGLLLFFLVLLGTLPGLGDYLFGEKRDVEPAPRNTILPTPMTRKGD